VGHSEEPQSWQEGHSDRHRFETGLCVVAATMWLWLGGSYLGAANSHERQLRVTYDPPRLSVEGCGVLLTEGGPTGKPRLEETSLRLLAQVQA
jgi:hypothetical protein